MTEHSEITCKLTRQDMTTHNGFQWEVGKWYKTDGQGNLCGPGWLHGYTHPLLAALLNPIHADIDEPRLWAVEIEGQRKDDNGLKFGATRMRLVKELPLPEVTTEQHIKFAILCAKQVYDNPSWNQWADDRAAAAAEAAEAAGAAGAAWAAWAARAAARAAAAAARAAWAAAANIDLIALAKEAVK